MVGDKEFENEKLVDVADVLITKPATVKMGAKAYEAIESLLETIGTRTVYVIDENDVLIGFIKFRDLLMVTMARYQVYKKGFFHFMKYQASSIIVKKPDEEYELSVAWNLSPSAF